MRFLFQRFLVGRLFGIPVLVMPAVGVLTLILLASAGHQAGAEGVGWMLGMLLLLAGALLAHELGHALVARRLRVHVVDITIWPLGGMAHIQDMTERPGLEALIALGGPAANLLLAGAFALLSGGWAHQATILNLILGLGNLAPAFPLDGGRVLRAWLAMRSPLVDATRAAVSIAGVLTLVLVILAILNGAALLGLLLGAYIFWFGGREMVDAIRRTASLPTLTVGQVLRRALGMDGQPGDDPPRSPPDEPPSTPDDLEHFRGSLDEFFRRRR